MADKPDWSAALRPAPPGGATIIAQERARSIIPVDQLAGYLLTPDFLERQDRVLKVLLKEPVFKKANQANLSRPDRYKLGLARGKKIRQLKEKLGWDEEDYHMAAYLCDDVLPYHLHTAMFITTVSQQGSDAQRARWVPRIERWEIIGAYAQTELGHGSNVRGIELEARWDPETREFILHSPHLTASKWWNGTMGRTATHAIAVAQLMLPVSGKGAETKYKSYGPHPFIVQIRDSRTHQPPESIIIGDIGPKYGYASMDNGYMLFNNHRVPHDAMLSRYSRVDPETGKYTKPETPEVVYGSLTHVRATLVMEARLALARAVTVAVRYLSIRRQFRDKDSDNPSDPEMPVLDYSTVQVRIFPLLATAFALHYSGKAMGELYARTRKNIEENGDFETLAELHSTSSGLKSLATDLTAGGIEICRRAMGGHGFGASGLVQLNANYLSKPTVEGDNWMITQQVARYLIKKAKALSASAKSRAGTRTEESLKRYLYARQKTLNLKVYEDDNAILEAFEWRTAHLVFKAYEQREIQKKSWNSLLIDFHKLSRAYSQSILILNFHQALQPNNPETARLDSTTRAVLRDLFLLFAFTTMDADAREFSSSGAVSNDALDALSARILELMGRIRPHAVRLVDAWKIPDFLLDSALGRYDGKVYEDLFDRAHRQNPLNAETFNPDYRSDEIVLGSEDAGQILSKL
ncbi:acyl-CoA oxidase [Coccidioides immitis RS]|uniref:Acyl-coenzyme A oxidase n=2 Tax=Coccidioides immitis TaxID=5501 RepID=A0A0D8JT34_COCIM|nr:acyl-CoA oxidase [Coccidioides immitis RS]KJF60106.1 acyl-CoA oxidase [Coccidioides immitis RS]